MLMNIALYTVSSTVSRTKKGVLTAVEAETCARPNLGTSMVAGAILALLQVVQITRKWRQLRAVSSYLFLVGWRSAFGAQSNAKRTTSSLDDIGWNTTIAPDSAQRQISKPLESVVRKWSNRQTKRRAHKHGQLLRLHHGNFPQKLVKRRA
jgi:2-methylisocitrate lyase-like PEP mutase family enzyme